MDSETRLTILLKKAVRGLDPMETKEISEMLTLLKAESEYHALHTTDDPCRSLVIRLYSAVVEYELRQRTEG